MAAATKKKRKEEVYPWKAGASSGHITNLKQSCTFYIYGLGIYLFVNKARGVGSTKIFIHTL
jgi:hypothetical protein